MVPAMTPLKTLHAVLLISAVVFGSVVTAPLAVATPSPVSSCSPASDAQSDRRIADLTEPSGIDTFVQARDRIAALRAEFTHPGDYRGTFPLAFDEILQLVGPSIESGIYADPVWAEDLAVEVVRLYVAALHEQVTGGTPAPHWASALALTAQCDRSPGRVLMGAIFAHLIVDFPHALVTIGSTPEHTGDFYTFGGALVDAAPAIVRDFESTYGTDLGPLFTGWFVGDLIGGTQTTTLLFQSTRTAAWVNSFALQNPVTHDATLAEMDLLLGAANLVLDGLEIADQI